MANNVLLQIHFAGQTVKFTLPEDTVRGFVDAYSKWKELPQDAKGSSTCVIFHEGDEILIRTDMIACYEITWKAVGVENIPNPVA